MGRKAGLSDEKLLAVTEPDVDRDRFTDAERLVIELADAMVSTPAHIADEFFVRLRAQFSEVQLLELSAQLAFENYRARMNRVFDVGSDGLYRPGEAAGK